MMTQVEQEALFKYVREDRPEWPMAQASGFVHGFNDAKRGMVGPQDDYKKAFKRGTHDYANGYVLGFIDAYGPDAPEQEWAQDIQEAF